MSAHVVERSELTVSSANDNDGLFRNVRSHKLTWPLNLFGTPNHLPGAAEHRSSFEFSDARVDVPRGGNCKCL